MQYFLLAVILLIVIILVYIKANSHKDNPAFFRFFINGYRNLDKKSGIKTCENVFTGSSVMKFWESLESDLQPNIVINRAIPGTKINEISFYVDDLVNKYNPKKVFLYAGSNDIQGDKPKTADQVLDGFINFVNKVKRENEGVKIYYISIIVSPAKTRMRNRKEIEDANNKIMNFCQSNEGLAFIDLTKDFLDDRGNPKEDLFKQDKIHLQTEAYGIWKDKILEYL
jgi:lysophospholipase L1-like esterase